MSPAATPDTSASPAQAQALAGPTHANSVNGGGGGMNEAQIRSELERTLLKLSQDLYEMEICAGDVVAGQEDRVPKYLREIDRGLIQLSELAGRMGDSVPRQVVDFIDRHRNPHAYTRATLNRATGENQYALGRTLGLESFRRQLESGLGEEFPDLPLPQRRHQPQSPSQALVGNENQAENSGSTTSGEVNQQVKEEERETRQPKQESA